LKFENKLSSNDVLFRFRATGHNDAYKKIATTLEINDLIQIKERKGYQFALSEMLSADVLMIFQHQTCNWQTPAKLYEYFKANKPVLAFCGNESDTLKIIKSSGIPHYNAELNDLSEIKRAIVASIQNSVISTSNPERFSREQATQKLAALILLSK